MPAFKDGWAELTYKYDEYKLIMRRGGRLVPTGIGTKKGWQAPAYLDHQENFGPWLNGGNQAARDALLANDPFQGRVYLNVPYATPDEMTGIDARVDAR